MAVTSWKRTIDPIAETQAARARISPVSVSLPPNRLNRLPATMQRLREGSDLRIVMLGDSIVNDMARSCWHVLVGQHYPNCEISRVASVRGVTGCWFYKQPEKLQRYVLDHHPHLVMIGGVSQNLDIASIRDCLTQILAVGPCEFFLMTGPFGAADPTTAEDWRKQREREERYAGLLKSLADEFRAEYLDLQQVWGDYIRATQRPLEFFKRDPMHANAKGEAVLARILEQYFQPGLDDRLGVPVASLMPHRCQSATCTLTTTLCSGPSAASGACASSGKKIRN